MSTHDSALLQHVTRHGQHYDWLIRDPHPPTAGHPMWTLRIGLASWQWADVDALVVETIAHHRAVYLTRQGDIGGGRGCVTRVDRGTTRYVQWSADVRRLAVAFVNFTGSVELQRLGARRWRLMAHPTAGRVLAQPVIAV